jgi:uncharacterized protein (UPF0335 family)
MADKKRGRPKKHATADGEALRNSIDSVELQRYVQRIENVHAEIADLNADRRAIFKEVKAAGYDAATVRTIIKRRATEPDKRQLMDELLDLYAAALGDFASTPLGEAGAEAVRSGARA